MKIIFEIRKYEKRNIIIENIKWRMRIIIYKMIEYEIEMNENEENKWIEREWIRKNRDKWDEIKNIYNWDYDIHDKLNKKKLRIVEWEILKELNEI